MILFGFQASVILEKPLIILLIAIPLLIQTYGVYYCLCWSLFVEDSAQHSRSCSHDQNFKLFELAVAVAISLFGLNSGAALATVVGVLVEVPVMLSLVAIVNLTRPAFSENQL